MFFSTVIEIIAAVFIVYGLYFAAKTVMFKLVYEKKIRDSIFVAVRITPDDDEEMQKVKMMCANQMSHEFMTSNQVYIIDDKEKE